jgi:hypothetical protein
MTEMMSGKEFQGSGAFLDVVNSAAADSAAETVSGKVGAALPGDAEILAAVNRNDVSDMSSLGEALGTDAGTVTPIYDKLAKAGFIDEDGDKLGLSPTGLQALDFVQMTRSS